MTTKADYINYKLQRAEDSLKAAELLLENNFWPDALSKTYHAAFYTVGALLTNLKLNPKTHVGAKSLFNKEFVMTGIVDEKLSRFYSNLMARWFDADYEVFTLIKEEEVVGYIDEVKKFIEIAKEIIGTEK